MERDFENQKNWLIELYVQQGLVLVDKLNKSSTDSNDPQITSTSNQLLSDIINVYRSLQKLIDINDEKAAKFTLKFLLSQKFYGKALKLLFKQADDKPANSTTEQAILNVHDKFFLLLIVSIHEYFSILFYFL